MKLMIPKDKKINLHYSDVKFAVMFLFECIESMLLCFHRNVFYIYIQMLSDDLHK